MIFPLASRKLIRGFQAHIDAGLGGAVDYSASYEPLFLPFDGEVSFFSGVQGGNWLRLKREGETWEFAHLDRYLVQPGFYREGTKVAVTGNTGQVTSGPHLHLQIFGENGRIDAEKYFMYNFHLKTVNGNESLLKEVQKLVDHYSNGQIKFTWENTIRPIYDGDILIDIEAFPILDELGIREPSILFYSCTGPSVWGTTWTYGNMPFILADSRITPFNLCFEIAHAIQKLYNLNRGANPGITIEDQFTPTVELMRNKFSTVVPYIEYLNNLKNTKKMMTESEVKNLYRLAFYRLPEVGELAYWVGRPLAEFLAIAIEDRANFLKKPL